MCAVQRRTGTRDVSADDVLNLVMPDPPDPVVDELERRRLTLATQIAGLQLELGRVDAALAALRPGPVDASNVVELRRPTPGSDAGNVSAAVRTWVAEHRNVDWATRDMVAELAALFPGRPRANLDRQTRAALSVMCANGDVRRVGRGTYRAVPPAGTASING